MMDIFTGKPDRKLPRNLKDCTKLDTTAAALYEWSARLDQWGSMLCGGLVVLGIISTISDAVMMYDTNDDLVIVTIFTSLVTWGLYAFVEFCTYNALVLLLRALASITQNTIVSANVALYEASLNHPEDLSMHPAAAKASTTNAQSAQTSGAPRKAPPTENMWECQNCLTYNKNEYGHCKSCGQYRS